MLQSSMELSLFEPCDRDFNLNTNTIFYSFLFLKRYKNLYSLWLVDLFAIIFRTRTRVAIPFKGNSIRKKQDTKRSQKGVVYIHI